MAKRNGCPFIARSLCCWLQRIDADEGAVAIGGSVLGVENADEVEGHKASMNSCGRSYSAAISCTVVISSALSSPIA